MALPRVQAFFSENLPVLAPGTLVLVVEASNDADSALLDALIDLHEARTAWRQGAGDSQALGGKTKLVNRLLKRRR
jgi:hypothetical protein